MAAMVHVCLQRKSLQGYYLQMALSVTWEMPEVSLPTAQGIPLHQATDICWYAGRQALHGSLPLVLLIASTESG